MDSKDLFPSYLPTKILSVSILFSLTTTSMGMAVGNTHWIIKFQKGAHLFGTKTFTTAFIRVSDLHMTTKQSLPCIPGHSALRVAGLWRIFRAARNKVAIGGQLLTAFLKFCWPCISVFNQLDTRCCVMQFWPPDDVHMCSKHVQAWNKTYCETNFVHQVG